MTKQANRSRIENDSMGAVTIPAEALWGAQTQRALANFKVSGVVFPREFIWSFGLVKLAAARANRKSGFLPEDLADAIIQAATEVMSGRLDDQFPLDVFQTGSGTSTNMNANEVIANRASELLGSPRGKRYPVHPNDHVNLGQSSNDVFPSCIHLAVHLRLQQRLFPALEHVQVELEKKSVEFDDVIKLGRTHLQDATPVRLGQEFSGYAAMVRNGIKRLKNTLPELEELALGGTAVGTGSNSSRTFTALFIESINAISEGQFKEAGDHFEAQGSKDALVGTSSALRGMAVSLTKIANDLRWLASGPHGGIAEIVLPRVQPGSSIMPGKVNPVILESLLQVCAQVIGNDATVAIAGLSGNFELNTMMPLLAHNILSSITIMANSLDGFRERCLAGISVNRERCLELVEKSLALVTALTPKIGYDRAAGLAKEAFESGKTLRDLLIEKKLFGRDEVDSILDPAGMTEPGE